MLPSLVWRAFFREWDVLVAPAFFITPATRTGTSPGRTRRASIARTIELNGRSVLEELAIFYPSYLEDRADPVHRAGRSGARRLHAAERVRRGVTERPCCLRCRHRGRVLAHFSVDSFPGNIVVVVTQGEWRPSAWQLPKEVVTPWLSCCWC